MSFLFLAFCPVITRAAESMESDFLGCRSGVSDFEICWSRSRVSDFEICWVRVGVKHFPLDSAALGTTPCKGGLSPFGDSQVLI